MSYLYPSADYAEDQHLERTILTTHVLSRGFQLGSAVGILSGCAISLFKRRPIPTLSLLRSAGTGGIVGAAIMGVGLVNRMWNREEIEWKDRTWRLRHNSSQVAVDNWSEPAAVLGTLATASRLGSISGNWRPLVGGAGVGSLLGIIGYMSISIISHRK